jgi:hypothetical protein
VALLPAQPAAVDDVELADLVRELVERGRLPHDRVFALIGGLLDRVDESDLVQHRYTASALLAVTEAAVRVQDRVTGFARDLVGVADVADAAPLAYGTSLSSWLTHRFPMPTRAAHRLVRCSDWIGWVNGNESAVPHGALVVPGHLTADRPLAARRAHSRPLRQVVLGGYEPCGNGLDPAPTGATTAVASNPG